MKVGRWLVVVLVMLLALGAFGLIGCGATGEGVDSDGETSGAPGDGVSGSINVEGSDTIVNMGQAWAEVYMEENPDVMISVKGGGSGTGIAALINGTVDFANASRSIKDEEVEEAEGVGIDPVEHKVAIDGIAVIINPDNEITGLSLTDLGKIYRGEISNWKDVGGTDASIIITGRDTSSGTYEYFKEVVVANDIEDAEYSPEMLNLASNQAIVDEVKNNAGAIGYVGLGYLTDEIKVAEVDGIAASAETAKDGSYAISRYLYMYSDGEPTGTLAAYLEWILGAEGQAIATDQGFVPVD